MKNVAHQKEFLMLTVSWFAVRLASCQWFHQCLLSFILMYDQWLLVVYCLFDCVHNYSWLSSIAGCSSTFETNKSKLLFDLSFYWTQQIACKCRLTSSRKAPDHCDKSAETYDNDMFSLNLVPYSFEVQLRMVAGDRRRLQSRWRTI